MMALKQWFAELPKKEQYLLVILSVIVCVYLMYLLGYRQLLEQRDYYRDLNARSEQSLQWMNETVAKIEALRQGGTHAAGLNQSMAQLAEKAASRAGIRISRFAPSDNNQAQIWFEKISFDQLVLCLSVLELEYAIHIENIDINAVSMPGMVNARLKVSR